MPLSALRPSVDMAWRSFHSHLLGGWSSVKWTSRQSQRQRDGEVADTYAANSQCMLNVAGRRQALLPPLIGIGTWRDLEIPRGGHGTCTKPRGLVWQTTVFQGGGWPTLPFHIGACVSRSSPTKTCRRTVPVSRGGRGEGEGVRLWIPLWCLQTRSPFPRPPPECHRDRA